MTLAFICVIGAILSAPVGSSAPHRTVFQQTNAAPAAPDPQSQQNQQQNTTQPQQNSTSSSSTTPASANPNPKPATTRKRKKKTSASNCPDTSANSTGATNASNSAAGNCPPKIKVVPHGGTSEPSIQLAGGDHAKQQEQPTAQQKETNTLLQSTEDNLKKIAGQQLTSDQQQMVNQARQFMDQSKSATHTGDLDRAYNLAWKAQVLSEELVKPKE